MWICSKGLGLIDGLNSMSCVELLLIEVIYEVVVITSDRCDNVA